MKLRTLAIEGFMEENTAETSEQLQILQPESPIETDLLAWTILSHAETVDGDSARREYVFQYQLGEQIDRGLYRLTIRCRDASGRDHQAEIVAGLVVMTGVQRARGFQPYWFMDKSLHFKAPRGDASIEYHRPAFGRLVFGSPGNLPHRRLFGATV